MRAYYEAPDFKNQYPERLYPHQGGCNQGGSSKILHVSGAMGRALE
jgi:hypothetical protein